MAEVRVTYTKEDGTVAAVPIDKDRFVVGRHSACDLCIQDERISREHLIIERENGVLTATDNRSRNGTELDGGPLTEPVILRDGARLVLGGGVELVFEFEETERHDGEAIAGTQIDIGTDGGMANAAGAAGTSGVSNALPAANKGTAAIPVSVFVIAPVVGLFLLLAVVGLIYVFRSPTAASRTSVPEVDDDRPVRNSSRTNSSTDIPEATPGKSTPSTPGSNSANAPPSANLSETARVEQAAASFLRRIAQNDPTAFVTSEQAARISQKAKLFAGSAAVADNINAARKSAAQIRSLAAARNLKPQLLATAALTKLGSTRGDVLATANSMADVLDRLSTQIGNELADDALLLIAAYDQGQKGEFLKLRNMLQDLAGRSSESSRTIRSIWFLEKQGKITQAEFEFALRFLALGAITQNPKDFGVNAEALTL